MNKGADRIFRYMSLYLSSGLDIVSALTLTERRIRGRSQKRLLLSMLSMVDSGCPVIDAFELMRKSGLLDSVAWSIIISAVRAGTLNFACGTVAEYARKNADMKRSFAGSLAYPMAVLASSFGMIYFLMSVIFPKVTPLFSSLGMPLPFVTRLMFKASGSFQSCGMPAFAFLILCLSLMVFLYLRNDLWKGRIERLLVFNAGSMLLFAPREYYRIALALSSLMKSGVTLPDSFRISAESSWSVRMRDAQLRVKEKIESGRKVSESIEEESVFEHEWVHMLSAGEMTGSLPSVLDDLASFYEKQFSERLQLAARWSEPIALFASAIVILAVALSVMQPMYAVIQFMHPV